MKWYVFHVFHVQILLKWAILALSLNNVAVDEDINSVHVLIYLRFVHCMLSVRVSVLHRIGADGTFRMANTYVWIISSAFKSRLYYSIKRMSISGVFFSLTRSLSQLNNMYLLLIWNLHHSSPKVLHNNLIAYPRNERMGWKKKKWKQT